jgi:putative peptidoglycan lipid II flippase
VTPASKTSLPRIFARLFPVNVAVQILSFAAWIALAHELGASSETDAYVLGLSIPLVVYGILLAANNAGSIPGLTEQAAIGEAEEAQAARELVSAGVALSAALALIITPIAMALAPLVLGGNSELISDTRMTMLELSPLAVFGATTGVLGAILAVRKSFVPAAAVMGFNPLLRIVLTLTLGATIGIQALIIANLLGGALSVAVLWALVRRSGIQLRLIRPAATPFVRQVAAVSAPLLISASVLQANPLVDRTMSEALGAGSVTAFELGTRLVPAGLMVALVASPLIATWSARNVELGWPAIQSSLSKALSSAAVIVLPLVAIGVVLREQLVTLAFHGGALTEHYAGETSDVFGMALLGMPFMVLSLIFSTLFVVKKETIVPMKLGFLNVVLNIGLNFMLRPVFGVAGVALSTTLTYATINVLQVHASRRRWGRLLQDGLWPFAPVLAAVALSTVAAQLLLQQMPSADTRAEAFVVAAVVGTIGLLVYGAAFLMLRQLFARAPRSSVDLHSRLETRT